MQQTPPDVDVFVVTFWSREAHLRRLFDSLAEPANAGSCRLAVHLIDNSVAAEMTARLKALVAEQQPRFPELKLTLAERNLGFGVANNRLLAGTRAPLVLLLNPDAALAPGALAAALAAVAEDAADPRVVAWEFRQQPYEHPKDYDPVTGFTGWVSGAAVLLRRDALVAVSGFDPRLFLYGEDVDLSWRLRARGYRLRYLTEAVAVHDSYAEPGQIKPAQTLGSTFANLCLRLRYGSTRDLLQGLAQVLREMRGPQAFPGRRRGLALNLLRFCKHFPHFARSRVLPTADFQPCFAGFDYEVRRKGAFHPPPDPALIGNGPLVSILVRTHRRPAMLAQALTSIARQTYRPLEVVVVEDGAPTAREVAESFVGRIDVRYHATGEPVGRARAGNLALSMARGEWLNFLDDDDLFYADHVHVLLAAALQAGLPGAYGIAFEVPSEVRSQDPLQIVTGTPVIRYQMPFNHLTLWTHNYLPIQSVLFHRSLYERHGGFAEDMDQLEDWNLWTRYTLESSFQLVDKTTSLYRVPLHPEQFAPRQHLLDAAYADACERQRAMRVSLSPRQLSEALQTSTLVPRVDPRSLRRQVLAKLPFGPGFLRLADRVRGHG